MSFSFMGSLFRTVDPRGFLFFFSSLCLRKHSLKQHFLTLSCSSVIAHIYMVAMAVNANQKMLLGFQEKKLWSVLGLGKMAVMGFLRDISSRVCNSKPSRDRQRLTRKWFWITAPVSDSPVRVSVPGHTWLHIISLIFLFLSPRPSSL